jgi:hypothetical protein
MAACKPAALCTLIMPSGKRCGGMALRNQRFCWAHSQNHRAHERGHARARMIDRLGIQIDAMTASELLFFLHQKLGRLRKTLNRFPDVNYTLIAALDRTEEIIQMESSLKQQIRQNQILLEEIRRYQLNSRGYAQNRSNQ